MINRPEEAMSTAKSDKLHVVFLPYLTTSHILPLLDAARLFASRDVKVTVIMTPHNASHFQAPLDVSIGLGHDISFRCLKFPAAEVGLPEGLENAALATTSELFFKVHQGIQLLQKPMEDLIVDINPHCIFTDLLYPWTVDVAEKLKIPRLMFYPLNFFYLCVEHNLKFYMPHEKVNSDSESFLIPGLPHKVEMKRTQLEDNFNGKTDEFMKKVRESELRSYGTVHNTFYELEPEYMNHYKNINDKGKKCWTIGPLSQFSDREKAFKINDHRHSCLNWLDTHENNKVVFINFGTMTRFPDSQLVDIAEALEASNCPFIWVVKKEENGAKNQESKWLPDGFEERLSKSNNGIILTSWAPQLEILGHPAVGGFMTHCGWNSSLEAISFGVPLITWPLFGEQFYNEKLVHQVLEKGVRVGANVWNPSPEINEASMVCRRQIEDGIRRLMCDSEESRKIRQKVKEIQDLAKVAVKEGGSSYESLGALIEELKSCAFGIGNIGSK